MPEIILRRVQIEGIMDISAGVIDNPVTPPPGGGQWDDQEARDNDWFGGSDDVWED